MEPIILSVGAAFATIAQNGVKDERSREEKLKEAKDWFNRTYEETFGEKMNKPRQQHFTKQEEDALIEYWKGFDAMLKKERAYDKRKKAEKEKE